MNRSGIPWPDAPNDVPELRAWERIAARALPAIFRPKWQLDLLYACDLARFVPPEHRPEISIDWFEDATSLSPAHRRFMRAAAGPIFWRMEKYRLWRRQWWLGVASLNGQMIHYTFTQHGGMERKKYGPVLRPRFALIGPCWTAESARGQGVYPYTVSCALQKLRERGFDWGYISVRAGNEASIRGILKATNWIEVGKFLMYRSPMKPYQIRAATILRPDATAFHSAAASQFEALGNLPQPATSQVASASNTVREGTSHR
ncbi:MAG: hypothetical protein JNG88_12945 [Phycisphaerales bacterium]|nr:hypothetical protein [Phycisphaerales bacterium]